jgi:hypothetical protein
MVEPRSFGNGLGKKFMGIKGKILAVLIVYFAGFATAIFALAPANPVDVPTQTKKQPMNFPKSFTKSDQFAQSFNTGMRKCIAAGTSVVTKAVDSVKSKPASAKEKTKNSA